MSQDNDKSSRLSRRTFIGSMGAVLSAGVACSSDDGENSAATGGVGDGSGGSAPTGAGGSTANASGGTTNPSTGGSATETGGDSPGSGGTGQGGDGSVDTGGTAPNTGGVSPGTGGTSAQTGGNPPTTGGNAPNTGGASQGVGGTASDTGGTSTNTGGTPAETGGVSQNSGGTDGNTGGVSENTGGSAGSEEDTGGMTGDGGTTNEGGSAGSGGDVEPAYVSMVRATGASPDWATATERAIELAGGLPDLTGLTVMLRPNVISADPSPTTTNPEVIRGVIRAVKKKGAATIQVADDGWATNSTTSAMESLGISAVCSEEGATPLDLKGGATTTMRDDRAQAFPSGMNFYNAVMEADFIVNIPVCKSHALANFTMALKAWYGHIATGRDHVNLGNQVAELHLVKQEGFVVLDATKAMVTGGPQSGQTAEPQIVVASHDAIAADVTGLCIHKHFGTGSGAVANQGVWEQPQIRRALALSFPGWLSAETDFSYVSEGIDEHAEIMARRND